MIMLASGLSGLPVILLYVLAVVIFLGVLYLILNLFEPFKPYARIIVLIVAGLLVLWLLIRLLQGQDPF